MKKYMSIVFVLVLVLSLSTSVFAENNYINWESEPNDNFANADMIIPYAYDNCINQGRTGSGASDFDFWFMLCNQPGDNVLYTLISPDAYDCDFVVYEQDSSGNKTLVGESRNPYGEIDYVFLPAKDANGNGRIYYICAFTKAGWIVSDNQPYQLIATFS